MKKNGKLIVLQHTNDTLARRKNKYALAGFFYLRPMFLFVFLEHIIGINRLMMYIVFTYFLYKRLKHCLWCVPHIRIFLSYFSSLIVMRLVRDCKRHGLALPKLRITTAENIDWHNTRPVLCCVFLRFKYTCILNGLYYNAA